MAKPLLLLIFTVVFYFELSSPASLECIYKTGDRDTLKNICYCDFKNDPMITHRALATINSFIGELNSNAEGFGIYNKICHYFPRGLENYFKNIKMISIYKSGLKEIHQEDLRPFPKLVELVMMSNSIEILEDGLFDFNPNLEWIDFDQNKIIHIESNNFNNLGKLRTLDLQTNICIKTAIKNSIIDVKNFIKSAKSQCINSDFASFKLQLENLKKDSKILNLENFADKFLSFKNFYEASKFFNFRPLSNKFEELKELRIEFIIESETSKMNEKLENINKSGVKEVKSAIDTRAIKLESLISQNNEIILNSVNASKGKILRLIGNVCTKDSIVEVKNIQKSIFDSVIKIHENSVESKVIDNLQKSINESLIDVNAKLNDLINATNQGFQNEEKILLKDVTFENEIKEQLKGVEKQLAGIKLENVEKFARVEKELTSTRHKITTAIDEKIKGIEYRLMKKFEVVLEEKIGKILEEKFLKFMKN